MLSNKWWITSKDCINFSGYLCVIFKMKCHRWTSQNLNCKLYQIVKLLKSMSLSLELTKRSLKKLNLVARANSTWRSSLTSQKLGENISFRCLTTTLEIPKLSKSCSKWGRELLPRFTRNIITLLNNQNCNLWG